jgi:hypothetical protein
MLILINPSPSNIKYEIVTLLARFYRFLFFIEHTDKVKSQTTRVHIVGENHLWPGICVDYFLSFSHIFSLKRETDPQKS